MNLLSKVQSQSKVDVATFLCLLRLSCRRSFPSFFLGVSQRFLSSLLSYLIVSDACPLQVGGDRRGQWLPMTARRSKNFTPVWPLPSRQDSLLQNVEHRTRWYVMRRTRSNAIELLLKIIVRTLALHFYDDGLHDSAVGSALSRYLAKSNRDARCTHIACIIRSRQRREPCCTSWWTTQPSHQTCHLVVLLVSSTSIPLDWRNWQVLYIATKQICTLVCRSIHTFGKLLNFVGLEIPKALTPPRLPYPYVGLVILGSFLPSFVTSCQFQSLHRQTEQSLIASDLV